MKIKLLLHKAHRIIYMIEYPEQHTKDNIIVEYLTKTFSCISRICILKKIYSFSNLDTTWYRDFSFIIWKF